MKMLWEAVGADGHQKQAPTTKYPNPHPKQKLPKKI